MESSDNTTHDSEMSAFECDFAEFKSRTKQFIDAYPSLDAAGRDAAWKAISHSYLKLNAAQWELDQAVMILKFIARDFVLPHVVAEDIELSSNASAGVSPVPEMKPGA